MFVLLTASETPCSIFRRASWPIPQKESWPQNMKSSASCPPINSLLYWHYSMLVDVQFFIGVGISCCRTTTYDPCHSFFLVLLLIKVSSRTVVLTHVLPNPRIPPGRAMLWSVQRGSIILLLFETAIRLSRCQDFTNSPSLNNPTKHPKTDSSQMYGWKAGDMDYMESMDKARLNPKWEKQISWAFWTEKKCALFQKLVKS